MESRIKSLMKDTFIYAIGTLGSKLIVFLLIPLYTYYLTAEQFGQVDLINTVVALLSPVICLQLTDGVYRFLIDNNNIEYQKKVLSTVNYTLIFNILLTSVITFALYKIFNPNINIVIIFLYIWSDVFMQIYKQALRAINRLKEFSILGLFNTLILCILNIYFITSLKLGFIGIILAGTIANYITVFGVYLVDRNIFTINYRYFELNLLKNMIKYSLPLILVGMNWWIINSSDRLIVAYLLDFAALGIYSLSAKFSSIVFIFSNVFFRAWQSIAIKHANDDDIGNLYSNVFNSIVFIVLVATLLITVSIRYVIKIMATKEYFEAWKQVPLLIIGVAFWLLSSMLSTVFMAKKESNNLLNTSLIASLVNIIINLMFINIIGIYAVSFSTMISFGLLFIIRFCMINKRLQLKINFVDISINIIFVIIAIFINYLNNDINRILLQIFILIIFFAMNLKQFKKSINVFLNDKK